MAQALRQRARWADGLSAERVRTELEKTSCLPGPSGGAALYLGAGQHLAGPADLDLTVLHWTEAAPLSRWRPLCGALVDWGASAWETSLRPLRLDKKPSPPARGRGPWAGRPALTARDYGGSGRLRRTPA